MTSHIGLLLLLSIVAILPACVAFAPQKFLNALDPTSPMRKGTATVSYYVHDVLDDAKGLCPQIIVPRWCSPPRTTSPLWAAAAAAEKDSHDHGADKENIVSDKSNDSIVPTTTTAAGNGGVGGYNPAKKLGLEREAAIVGDPQVAQLESMNITMVLTELQAIQSQGPKKYCILGTRHCSFLHQQIVEMLAYALVLSGNHIYTSGAAGTNAAAIRGALRAFQPQLLTVVLPQSMSKQTPESQELLQDVTNIITMPQNDAMPLDVASRICNSHLLSQTDQLISFAFHDSKTVLEAAQEAQKLNMLVTLLYLD